MDLLKEIIAGSKEATALSDANRDGKIDSSDIDLVDKIMKYEPANITIIDSSNRTVSLDIPVQSFAGLHTSPCREFMMLGIEDRVVGVTNYVFDDPDMYPRHLDKIDIGTIYLAGSERTEREDPTVHGDLANSAEFAGVATQSQRMKAESFYYAANPFIP